ncbi:hypothetical protein [Pseudoalteromonas sp. MMG022]|uniref:hypothetical protein n=1 Tax=Pseudoalteromonas sp. MMG022 TaxID=2909978 RepID=UPI001F20CFAB|nr:hypothetical protein [Pseudoalteromonas sp. MMG022]MCF6436994.1 hypothetical protein [Pseudoalteromonas sp. MMG022]
MLELDQLLLTGNNKQGLGNDSDKMAKLRITGADSAFLELLNMPQSFSAGGEVLKYDISANLTKQDTLSRGKVSKDVAQTTPSNELVCKLQNSQTLLFATDAEVDDVEMLEHPSSQALFSNQSHSVINLSIPTQLNSANTSAVQVKVTVTWGKIASGYLSQLNTSTSGTQGPQANLNNMITAALIESSGYVGRNEVDIKHKSHDARQANVLNQHTRFESVSNRAFEQFKRQAVIDGAKQFTESRYQAYPAQALFVLSSSDKELKVSARDFFNRHDHSKSILSWLNNFVSDEMLSQLSEYSFNGVTVWQREK